MSLPSISYVIGKAVSPSYAAGNGATTALTRALARPFGPDRIRVNALAPGWVFTRKPNDLWAAENGVKAHLARQGLPQMLKTEEMKEPLLLVAQASRAMTGRAMSVDRGVVVNG